MCHECQKSFYNEYWAAPSDEATALHQETAKAISPIIRKYIKLGFPVWEIEQRIIMEIVSKSAAIRLMHGLKTRNAKKKAARGA